MIKAIIFDCFGVLTTDTWREFCATLPKGKVLDDARRLNHTYDSGLMSLDAFLNKIKDLTGSTPNLLEEIPESKVLKNSDLLKYISNLKKTYKIGLLSNIASDWINDSFLSEDEQKYFDNMIFSYKTGMTKPNPKIFDLAAHNLGVDNQQVVMVDDIEQYCDAARKTGMKAITYLNFTQFKDDLEKILNDSNN